MKKSIFDLKQERAEATAKIREIMDRYQDGGEMTADDKETLGKAETAFDTLNGQIMAEEKQKERERIVGEKPADKVEKPMDEATTAFHNHLRAGSESTLRAYNDLQQGNPTQAGYLVTPEKFVKELIKEIDNTLFIRSKCKVMTLTGVQSLGFPQRTRRMNSAAWGTELSEPKKDKDLAFGKREFKPRPATAEILLSKTLMRNAPEVDGIVRAEMAYDFGELMENAYMTGDGADKPLGLFVASEEGISTARDIATGNTTTEMTFDGLTEAKYAIKNQYQAHLEWLFHRDGVKQLAKIKDKDGQYIWQPSVTENPPDRLMGRIVNMSEYVPNTFTAGNYVGLIGDFRNYWIVDSLTMEIQVLAELYARSNQIDYIGRLETDGMPVLEECFARVKLATA